MRPIDTSSISIQSAQELLTELTLVYIVPRTVIRMIMSIVVL